MGDMSVRTWRNAEPHSVTVHQAARVAINFARGAPGFYVYDLQGLRARQRGLLQEVDPWTFLLPGALGGYVTYKDLWGVLEEVGEFATLLRAVPDNRDLHEMDTEDLATVKELCRFSCYGVQAAKVTKVAALFRPAAVPILDRDVGRAYGRQFSGRPENQSFAIEEMARNIEESLGALVAARAEATKTVSDLGALSLLRFFNILVWANQRGEYQKTAGRPKDLTRYIRPYDTRYAGGH